MGCLLRLVRLIFALAFIAIGSVVCVCAIYFGITWFLLDTAIGSWFTDKVMAVVFGIVLLLNGGLSGLGTGDSRSRSTLR